MLKLIAFLTMFVDHAGYLFYDNDIVMRTIGRVSFPLFAMILAYNYANYTKDPQKYKKRLLVGGVASQIPFTLVFVFPLNIFFTFYLGIALLESVLKKEYHKSATFALASLFVDYSVFGVVFVALLAYRYKKEPKTIMFVLIGAVIVAMQTTFFGTEHLAIAAFVSVFLFGLFLIFDKIYAKDFRFALPGLYYVYPGHLLLFYLLTK